MKKSSLVLFALSGVIALAQGFDVPEPVFEVFHPKGLRVSLPDTEGIQSVQFFLSLKLQGEDIVELFDDPEEHEDGRWTYWNPDAVLEKDDQIFYKITVEYDDLYWNKSGEYTVDTVYSLDGGITESKPHRFLGFGGLENVNVYRHRNRGLITEGKKSSYHSSYSSYQGPDSKPITRSSTSSATGTFVMKANGEVEASGYKKSESYDSTKREGEQWEMRESEMTPEELEELKRFIGPSFRSFSDLTAGQVEEFKRLHSANFHLPERLQTPLSEKAHAGAARTYEESYFKESSSSSSTRNQGTGDYGRRPSGFQQYHERQSAHESSSSSSGRLKPVYRAPDPIQPSSSNHYEEHRYNHQSSSSIAQPLSSLPEYRPFVDPIRRYASQDQGHSASGYAVNHQSAPPTPTNPSPSYLTDTEVERQSQSFGSRYHQRYDDYEDEVQKVEKPKYQAESHYTGSIFRSVATSRVNHPQECTVWAENNYDRATNVIEIQKSISKMKCLASVAEHSMKEELRLVKQTNSELTRKLEALEREFRRFENTCRCSA